MGNSKSSHVHSMLLQGFFMSYTNHHNGERVRSFVVATPDLSALEIAEIAKHTRHGASKVLVRSLFDCEVLALMDSNHAQACAFTLSTLQTGFSAVDPQVSEDIIRGLASALWA